tara:strand:- start:13285 stop:13512 length:228 start_codon:yes stop_codon:yes gene_type:complete
MTEDHTFRDRRKSYHDRKYWLELIGKTITGLGVFLIFVGLLAKASWFSAIGVLILSFGVTFWIWGRMANEQIINK